MRIVKKILFSLILVSAGAFGFISPVAGQERSADTIIIREVVISGKSSGLLSAGYKKSEIDQSILGISRQKNIADVISENSFIFIKSYGLGGMATTSIRGAGASQTQVTWNGININNPMPGQSDLAIIPSWFADKVQIYYGGSSMTVSAGGIGGVINLETGPSWKNETSVILNPGFGSFGRYTGSAGITSGNNRFQTVTKAYFESAENDFSYINNVISAEPVRQTRKNSQFSQNGFLQELYFKKDRSLTSARVWYQSAKRNLPSPMIQSDAGESQGDQSLRAMLNYNSYRGKLKYSVAGASLFNSLNYFNHLVSIDSRNLSGKFVLRTGLEAALRNNLILKTSLNDELSAVESNNYHGKATRNVFNLSASLEKRTTGRLGASILLRETINENKFLLPDFTAGLEFKLFEFRNHLIKGNFSRNSKIPDMNDLFWIPGGNRELRNEYALSAEVMYQADEKVSPALDLLFDISLFRNSVKDMISWYPGEFSYWTAGNIAVVNSTGAETSASATWSHNDFSAKLYANYSFTSARAAGENEAGKQLIYVPGNRLNSGLIVWFRKLNASWSAGYTGTIFTTPDNSDYLPGFILNNAKAGYRLKLGVTSVDFHFNIDNLFNTSYQVIAMHPMPGRYYSFDLLFNIVK